MSAAAAFVCSGTEMEGKLDGSHYNIMGETSVHLFDISTVGEDPSESAKGVKNLTFDLAKASGHVTDIPKCERFIRPAFFSTKDKARLPKFKTFLQGW